MAQIGRKKKRVKNPLRITSPIQVPAKEPEREVTEKPIPVEFPWLAPVEVPIVQPERQQNAH